MPKATPCAMLFLVGCALAAGCAETGYLGRRGRDALDIATCTVGVGTGLRARVGPVHVAAIENSDLAGLRDGEWFSDGNDLVENRETYAPFPIPHQVNWTTDPVRDSVFQSGKPDPELVDLSERVRKRERGGMFGQEIFQRRDLVAVARDKGTRAYSPFPLLAIADRPPYYSQVEAVAGLGLSLRLGLNPGELLDFLLGWGGLDLYGDDARRLPPPPP